MPRQLDLRSLDDVAAEVERLHRGGAEPLGKWDFAQACDHLRYFIDATMDGYGFTVPWLPRALFGRFMLRRILKKRSMMRGVPTPQKPAPQPGGDEAVAVARLLQSIARMKSHAGPFHDSPFFGSATPEQTRDLQVIHCQHHLAFFQPK